MVFQSVTMLESGIQNDPQYRVKFVAVGNSARAMVVPALLLVMIHMHWADLLVAAGNAAWVNVFHSYR